MALLTACSGAKSPGSGGSGTGGGNQDKVIKIGLIAPLTGDVKTFGESSKKGFDLALEQAGKKAGEYTIEVVMGDDRNDPTEGVNIATKMITQDKVKAIVGSVTSKVTIPVTEVANQSKTVVITGTGTAAGVTVDAKGEHKPFAFRACFIDPFQGQVAAKFAADNLKAKTAAVLYDKGNDYTVGLSDSFKKNFEAAGGKIVAWESYSKDDADFSAVITNVAATKPDMLYLPDYYNKASLIAKAAKSKGLNVPMMGGDGWDSADLDYAALDGQYFTAHYSADDTRDEVKTFVSAFQKKYNEKPDSFAALVYDATNIVLEGIRKAGTNDSDKIRQAIQDMKDYQTVGGKISFDKSGNPIKSAAILQVSKDKTYKFITSVKP
jgi:branched-chain amino acid transport system substrate-binding protein